MKAFSLIASIVITVSTAFGSIDGKSSVTIDGKKLTIVSLPSPDLKTSFRSEEHARIVEYFVSETPYTVSKKDCEILEAEHELLRFQPAKIFKGVVSGGGSYECSNYRDPGYSGGALISSLTVHYPKDEAALSQMSHFEAWVNSLRLTFGTATSRRVTSYALPFTFWLMNKSNTIVSETVWFHSKNFDLISIKAEPFKAAIKNDSREDLLQAIRNIYGETFAEKVESNLSRATRIFIWTSPSYLTNASVTSIPSNSVMTSVEVECSPNICR